MCITLNKGDAKFSLRNLFLLTEFIMKSHFLHHPRYCDVEGGAETLSECLLCS